MRNAVMKIAALVALQQFDAATVARYERIPNHAKRIMGQYDPGVMRAGVMSAYRRPRSARKARLHVRAGGRKTRHRNGKPFNREFRAA